MDFGQLARQTTDHARQSDASQALHRTDSCRLGRHGEGGSAKYRFLHRDPSGWDVAVFPRVFLPSVSSSVGDPHASLLVPVWLQRDFGKWSTFGGGGCVLSRGGDSVDFCLRGWAITNQIAPHLQVGAEIAHSAADTRGGRASTAIGAGLRYDLTENYHVLAYVGPTLQNAAETADYSWYASFLLTL